MTLQLIDLNTQPELTGTVAQWHQDAFGYLNPRRSVAERLARLQEHLDSAAIPTTFVALFEGTPVGCASLVAADMSLRPELTPWLAGVYVLPTHRQRGVGGRLVRQVVAAARGTALPTLHLYTTDRVAFYQRLGWRVAERLLYRGHLVAVMTTDLAAEVADV